MRKTFDHRNPRLYANTLHKTSHVLYVHRTIGLGMVADVFPTNRLGVVMGTVLTAHTV